MHPHYSWRSTTKVERIVAGSSEHPIVYKRVALNGKCLIVVQIRLVMVAPLYLPKNPLVTLEA